jgi:hypothetical protein
MPKYPYLHIAKDGTPTWHLLPNRTLDISDRPSDMTPDAWADHLSKMALEDGQPVADDRPARNIA